MDRNNSSMEARTAEKQSPPARVAWIETSKSQTKKPCNSVATREGGVDRNILHNQRAMNRPRVATREGGVDRNTVELVEVK